MTSDTTISQSTGVRVTETPVGFLGLAASARGVRRIVLGDDPRGLREFLVAWTRRDAGVDPVSLDAWSAVVSRAIEVPSPAVDLPFDSAGSAFQREVWQALRAIPPGQTVSYTELAHAIDRPNAVRAVAQACAANPLAIVIPCHRVLRRDGGLGGYRWGIDRKRQLLEREGVFLAAG